MSERLSAVTCPSDNSRAVEATNPADAHCKEAKRKASNTFHDFTNKLKELLDPLRSTTLTKKSDRDAACDDVNKFVSQKADEMRAILNKVVKEFTVLGDQIVVACTVAEVSTMPELMDSVVAQTEQIAQLTRNENEMREELEGTAHEHNNLRAECDDLRRNERVTNPDVDEEMAELRRQNAQLQHSIAQLEKTVAQLQEGAADEEMSQSEKDLQYMKRVLKRKEETRASGMSPGAHVKSVLSRKAYSPPRSLAGSAGDLSMRTAIDHTAPTREKLAGMEMMVGMGMTMLLPLKPFTGKQGKGQLKWQDFEDRFLARFDLTVIDGKRAIVLLKEHLLDEALECYKQIPRLVIDKGDINHVLGHMREKMEKRSRFHLVEKNDRWSKLETGARTLTKFFLELETLAKEIFGDGPVCQQQMVQKLMQLMRSSRQMTHIMELYETDDTDYESMKQLLLRHEFLEKKEEKLGEQSKKPHSFNTQNAHTLIGSGQAPNGYSNDRQSPRNHSKGGSGDVRAHGYGNHRGKNFHSGGNGNGYGGANKGTGAQFAMRPQQQIPYQPRPPMNANAHSAAQQTTLMSQTVAPQTQPNNGGQDFRMGASNSNQQTRY